MLCAGSNPQNTHPPPGQIRPRAAFLCAVLSRPNRHAAAFESLAIFHMYIGQYAHHQYCRCCARPLPWPPLGLSGPQGHFGCKWLPWGSPVRAPLATVVALPRAFMPISSPRIRVQLCTAAYSCTSSDSYPKAWLPRLTDVPGGQDP